MNPKKDNTPTGIAGLFEKDQLRNGFLNFLYIIAGLEMLIFVITLVASIGLAKEAFPWKTYLFVAFTVPVALTFLVGIFILAFNHFYFGHAPDVDGDSKASSPDRGGNAHLLKANSLLDSMRKVPIMLTLFILIIGSMALYKLGDALMVIVNTSEQLVKYLFVGMGVLLLCTTLIAFTWLYMNYKLRKKRMDHQVAYRRAAMERHGLLILDDQPPVEQKTIMRAPFHHQVNEEDAKKKGLIRLPNSGEYKEGGGL